MTPPSNPKPDNLADKDELFYFTNPYVTFLVRVLLSTTFIKKRAKSRLF
jgi:hypothetical protein